VTGPNGSEIYSNNHLQVKVRFHWDRNGNRLPDEQSSCWIRVSQPWAGKKRGFFAIPRVGDEVIVAFEEGDPDRPLIIGSVYNDVNRSKHPIQTNETRTGLVTLSSKQGADNFNELSFEDKKGSELIYLRAEKDLQQLVNHDVMTQVNHDVITQVDHDVTITVDNNVTEEIKNNHSVKIGNNDTVKVANNRVVDIGQAESLKAGTNITIKAGQTITIEAGTTITLKAGPSTIELGPSGITIKGPIVKIN
jgi:type VI secretion system secreted protein VgrG